MKYCPSCHHVLSCRFNADGVQCYCNCHDLADAAPDLFLMLVKMFTEAVTGSVLDVTAREAAALLEKYDTIEMAAIIKTGGK